MLLLLAMECCGGQKRKLEDNEMHCMMKVSFGHSLCGVAVSQNKYNLVSIVEIQQANYRRVKKPLVGFDYTLAILCPAEKIALEIASYSNMDLVVQNAMQNAIHNVNKIW